MPQLFNIKMLLYFYHSITHRIIAGTTASTTQLERWTRSEMTYPLFIGPSEG